MSIVHPLDVLSEYDGHQQKPTGDWGDCPAENDGSHESGRMFRSRGVDSLALLDIWAWPVFLRGRCPSALFALGLFTDSSCRLRGRAGGIWMSVGHVLYLDPKDRKW